MAKNTSYNIAVLGLGYVGLPVAVAFAEKFEHVVGFDVNEKRVETLNRHIDHTGEIDSERLANSGLKITHDLNDIAASTVYIVCVPTPINVNKEPDLTPLLKACETLAKVLKKGDVIVFESTVYPGVTEEICGPELARLSGLQQSIDFKLGYSPERINPGDKVNRLETINKIISGEDNETAQILKDIYKAIITQADVHLAPDIKVAEMAKALENTQRDVNIALINEIAVFCEKIGIRTADVLDAAGTKWNFLPFKPGLVGGHCIGVDPYYLTSKSEHVGHHAHLIQAARRINNDMAKFVAQKTIKMLVQKDKPIRSSKIGILGLAFKEDVGDIRNSKIPDIVKELHDFGATPILHDPHADADETVEEFGVSLSNLKDFNALDALIYAVPHRYYQDYDILSMMAKDGLLIDVKSKFNASDLTDLQSYWSL